MSEINDDTDNFSFASSSNVPSHRQSSRNNSSIGNFPNDMDSDLANEEASSLTEILSTKNDLKAKYEAMMATKKMYEKQAKELQQKINVLNDGSDISLRILDQRKEFCIKENDRLQKHIRDLPTVETLQKQISTLTELLDIPTPSQACSTTSFLDVLPLQEIGLLSPDESMAILPQRLHSLENKLNYLLDSKKRGQQNQSFLISNGNGSEKEIKKQISIIENSSTTATAKAKLECQNLEKEVSDLREEIRLLKERQEKKQTPPPIREKQIKETVASAGGDPKKIHKVRGRLYKYESNLFTIELRFKQIYAITKEIELPLATYIQSLVSPPKTRQLHHSIL
ncbi:hypothetical protein M9Y10_009566 [Tritrichomonas musculus]|uniref:Uncharacterized protein n=1 Tax=Tritrichomonas musculus TaxID=1915356 RepID=A0ABR2INV9_9EUKA